MGGLSANLIVLFLTVGRHSLLAGVADFVLATRTADTMTESTGPAAPTNRAAATSVGGSRTALARRPANKSAITSTNSGRKGAGGGIMKFYTDDAPGLKVGPTMVLVLALVFMAIVCSLHILGKFRSG